MEQSTWWVFTTVIGLMIAGLGFFIKKWMTRQEESLREMRSDFQVALACRDQRLEKLEEKLNDTIEGLPYKYTLRDDFIRAMGGVETKLNKILDKLSGLGG